MLTPLSPHVTVLEIGPVRRILRLSEVIRVKALLQIELSL